VWIAIHELSQAQWRRLVGTSPWLTAVPVASTAPWHGDALPAFGMGPLEAETALADVRLGPWRLGLPDAAEWERACLADGIGRYAWGDALDGGVAVCAAAAPAAIGTIGTANAWGFFDMHGNIAEMVRGERGYEARGGSWDQPVEQARASNRVALGDATASWAIGVRLVLRR
jgi:formylglycine-generating enzyme required for sulfatase activity